MEVISTHEYLVPIYLKLDEITGMSSNRPSPRGSKITRSGRRGRTSKRD